MTINNEEEFAPEAQVEEGKISISKEVVTSIAGLAATEVEGIVPSRGEEFPKGEAVKRFVDTEVGEGEVRIRLKVGVKYGYPVREVAQKLQERVKGEIEKMTGLRVSAVDVEVTRLAFPEEEKPKEGE